MRWLTEDGGFEGRGLDLRGGDHDIEREGA